jgi:hypothetical protein
MNIKIFMGSASNNAEREILRAFGAGIQLWINTRNSGGYQELDHVRIGRWQNFTNQPEYQLTYEYQESYQPCDVAVIFGSWKPREKGSHNTRNSVVANAPRFFVIETPLLNRQTSQENHYWRVGYQGYLNRDAEWPILPRDVAKQRLSDLNVNWSGWNNSAQGHILLALQLPGDASLRGADINDWAYRTVIKLRRHTDREIVIRNHPLCSDRAFVDHGELAMKLMRSNVPDLRFSDGASVPWAQDIHNAWCTVTYSSGLAVDSVLSGIPTIACDEGNFAWGISSNDPEQVNDIRRAGRDKIYQWMDFLAGCQWNTQEMREGSAWRWLSSLIEQTACE